MQHVIEVLEAEGISMSNDQVYFLRKIEEVIASEIGPDAANLLIEQIKKDLTRKRIWDCFCTIHS